MEPDLRAPDSQPSCVLYTLEVLYEAGIRDDGGLARGALDWLQTVTNEDGGVPFVLPAALKWPHAPWWSTEEDPVPSSSLITAAIAAMLHRLGIDHPWVGPATDFCWRHADELPHGGPYTLRYFLDFLDAVDDEERAKPLLDAVAEKIPDDGVLTVHAGTEGEEMRPLELAPRPDHLATRLFSEATINNELDRLEQGQQDDGGWTFTWANWNPAATCEWRGMVTVSALRTLQAYGRLETPAAAQ
jgi:hypothetical protein